MCIVPELTLLTGKFFRVLEIIEDVDGLPIKKGPTSTFSCLWAGPLLVGVMFRILSDTGVRVAPARHKQGKGRVSVPKVELLSARSNKCRGLLKSALEIAHAAQSDAPGRTLLISQSPAPLYFFDEMPKDGAPWLVPLPCVVQWQCC